MLRQPVSLIILSMLVVSALALAFNVQPVNSDYVWTETIYINADGSISPPTAPISSVDNVTYTLTDNIAGNVTASSSAIIIQRNNTIIDGAGHTLQGTNASDSWGIGLTGRSNVTIKNMKITAFFYGIRLGSSSNNSVSGNNITANNGYGVYLYGSSSNNSVSGNNITANNGYGVYLGASNNSVSGNTVANSAYGIYLGSSNNNSVSGNTVANSGYGIELDYSSNNSVSGNSITANNATGIYIYSSSNYNSIAGNNITANNIPNNATGVVLDSSSNNNVGGNNIANNGLGVVLYSSSNSNVSGNNIVTNTYYGILLDSSSNNGVSGNNITANNEYGMYLYSSSNNTIYHNNIINNTGQVYSSGPINAWDNGYPSGGNFWSDYNGTDEKSGPNQTQPGYDGIGDVPYIIAGNNTDRYPLMQPLTGAGVLIVQTPTGSNVTVSPMANASITFANVTAGGFTSLNTVQPPTDQFVSVTCNEIRTSANYTGNVTLEFAYDPSGLSLQDQQAMKIWLWNDSSSCWVDVTTYVNTTSHVVYGMSPHLSMFGVTSNLGITGDLGVPGTTTVSLPANPPPPPSYWMALNYYQINTTKVLPAPISLRLAYNYQSIQPGQELSVQIMMWNETSLRWDDITTGVDMTSHVVYGLAPHLSMFGVTCLQPSSTVGGGGGSRMPYMN